MANTVTLNDLITSIRDVVDMADTQFVTNPMLKVWINSALSELHDLLVDRFEDFFCKQTDITLSTATSYQLPGDFQKALKVFYKDAAGNRLKLNRFMLDSLDTLNSSSSVTIDSESTNLKYRIIGNEIFIYPTPSAGGFIELWYVPQVTKLVASTDIVGINLPIGWEDYIINSVAAKCLAREESDPSFFIASKNEVRQRIIQAASNRDAGEPNFVTDYYRRFEG